MTALAADIERPAILFADVPLGAARAVGRPQTLDAVLLRVWEDLAARGAAGCPVCGEAMVAHEHGGACLSCGSVLS